MVPSRKEKEQKRKCGSTLSVFILMKLWAMLVIKKNIFAQGKKFIVTGLVWLLFILL